METDIVIRKENLSKENLTKDELYFLRLIAHNYNNEQIKGFFCMDDVGISVLEKNVKRKLNETSFCNSIVKAFNSKLLDEYDFVDDINKSISLAKAGFIFREYSVIGLYLMSQRLKSELTDLLRVYEHGLKSKNKDIDLNSFSVLERAYINFRFLQENYINLERNELNGMFENINLSESQTLDMCKSLQNKLKVNSWYSAYVKGIELKMIKKPNCIRERTEIKMGECRKNILYILKLKRLSEKDKIYGIYRELVSLLATSTKFF
jgi:hypothetical protein